MAGRGDLVQAFTTLSHAVAFELGRLDMIVKRRDNQTHLQAAAQAERLEKALKAAQAALSGEEVKPDAG